ncbi:hypothetical protein ACFT7S_31410 [Streptomyces sp. NPDC057136]|uniref:hypothetical protein n=1 Tax=Streptomyces sp. NPDC057136 TaxID=3346029 RepID=UPI00362FDB54
MNKHQLLFRRRRPFAAAALVASLGLLAGCAGSQSESSADGAEPRGPADSSASPSSPVTGDFTFRLPIAKYSYTAAEDAVIRGAEDVLTEQCMRKLGMSYRAVAAPEAVRASDRRYGLSSVEDASRYGYHLPPEPLFDQHEGLDAETLSALYGNSAGATGSPAPKGKIPPRGCRGEAVVTLASKHRYTAGAEIASGIANGSYEESRQDPRVRAAVGRWSSCMAERGYSYADPMASLGDKQFLDKKVGEQEIETAQADLNCKARTRLLQIWFAAETHIQNGRIAEHLGELEKLAKSHASKVAEARRITSPG